VSTWEDLPIAEEAEVVAVVIAAAVTVTMTTDTAEAADHAAVAVMAAEVADHPLLITEVGHEGTIARGQDLTHLVAIDSLFGGQSIQVQEVDTLNLHNITVEFSLVLLKKLPLFVFCFLFPLEPKSFSFLCKKQYSKYLNPTPPPKQLN